MGPLLRRAEMKVLRLESDIVKLSASLESLRATTREQQDLAAAGQRGSGVGSGVLLSSRHHT